MPKSVPSGTLENAAIIVFQHILIRPFQKACAYEIFHRLYEWESITCCPGWNRPCRWIVDKCICPCRVVLKPEFADTIPAMEEDIVLAVIYEFRSTVAFRKRNRRILFVICFV